MSPFLRLDQLIRCDTPSRFRVVRLEVSAHDIDTKPEQSWRNVRPWLTSQVYEVWLYCTLRLYQFLARAITLSRLIGLPYMDDAASVVSAGTSSTPSGAT